MSVRAAILLHVSLHWGPSPTEATEPRFVSKPIGIFVDWDTDCCQTLEQQLDEHARRHPLTASETYNGRAFPTYGMEPMPFLGAGNSE